MSETEKMAPTASMETVIIIRPYKVGAAVLGFLGCLLCVLFIGASDWVHGEGRTLGLWAECVAAGPGRVDCGTVEAPVWLMAMRGLVVIGLVMAFVASFVVCIGLNAGKMSTRYRCYFVGMLVYFLAAMFDITALVIFPVKYSEQLGAKAGNSWSLGWTYGVGWAIVALLVTCSLLLCLDKDTDEISFRERVDYENGIEDDDEVVI
ncbi:p53 apoptosis effector related to PMP-22-like [Dreissena polymorpha]|uniref:Uncharacterized protein n=1 Tax=Dreissena polymorpha TaxID=45954 RepID=A0A9D4JTG4_DREPO|nr:p53 apoptosis effector related to PMP-22-like [Dreissena polymorpha]KAH3822244.1 hypothetical protein DPMN_124018 [Dreissena polymorpha]